MTPSNNRKLIRGNLDKHSDTAAQPWDTRTKEEQREINKLLNKIRLRANHYFVIQFNIKGPRDLMGGWPRWQYPAHFQTAEDAWDYAAVGLTEWPPNAKSLSVEKVYHQPGGLDDPFRNSPNVKQDLWPYRRDKT